MKKIAVLLLCLLLAVGCQGKAASFVPQTVNFACTAAVQTAQTEFSCALTVDEIGVLTAVLLPPSGYEGLTVAVDGAATTLTYAGQSVSYASETMPTAFFATATADLLGIAAGTPFTADENGYTATGTCTRGDFSFTFDENGLPARLTLPAQNLTVMFRDFENLAKND